MHLSRVLTRNLLLFTNRSYPLTHKTRFSSSTLSTPKTLIMPPRRFQHSQAAAVSRPERSIPQFQFISSANASNISASDRQALIDILNESFREQTLDRSTFYASLIHNKPVYTSEGADGYADLKLAQLIRSHPVKEKRSRLEQAFAKFERKEPLGNHGPIQSTPKEPTPTQNKVMNGDLRTSKPTRNILSLASIIPDIGKHDFPLDLLLRGTGSRHNFVNDYMTEVELGARNHPRLQTPQRVALLKQLVLEANNQTNALISIDMEAHEFSKDKVTEIGISIYDPAKDALSTFPTIKNIHILPEEVIRLRNGAFVADNKDKFLGGSSIIMPTSKAADLIQCILNYYFYDRPGMSACIVGHNVAGDLTWLKGLGVTIPHNATVLDTQKIYNITHGDRLSSLGGILRRFDIPHAYLHNAGNDAYYTLMLLMKLCDPSFRRNHAVDSFEADEEYIAKMEEMAERPPPDMLRGSRPSKPRKAKKVLETLPPTRYTNYSHALRDLFQPKP